MFSVISTIRFCILQHFSDLQPSDFEHFNVLGNFNHQILRSSMFSVISTIRFCILQHFSHLQPSYFEHFNVLATSPTRFWAIQCIYFKVLCDFKHQILCSSMFSVISTIRLCVLQRFRNFNHKILSPSMFQATSTIRFCVVLCFL